MIHLLALLFYLGAFFLWIHFLVKGVRGRSARAASAATLVGVGLHAAALIGFWLEHTELPLVGPGAAVSSLAFVGGLALAAFLPFRDPARLAIVLLPFITALQGAAMLVGIQPSPLAIDFQGAGFVLHVTFAFVGYQGLAVTFAAGLLYLVQHHELKEKRLGPFFHFIPPLATLDRIARIGIWAGLACLSLSLAFGWAWTVGHRGTLELSDPKVLWAILSWGVFLGIALARWGPGRTEYRGALAAVLGFGVVLGSYLVLRLTVGGEGLFL